MSLHVKFFLFFSLSFFFFRILQLSDRPIYWSETGKEKREMEGPSLYSHIHVRTCTYRVSIWVTKTKLKLTNPYRTMLDNPWSPFFFFLSLTFFHLWQREPGLTTSFSLRNQRTNNALHLQWHLQPEEGERRGKRGEDKRLIHNDGNNDSVWCQERKKNEECSIILYLSSRNQRESHKDGQISNTRTVFIVLVFLLNYKIMSSFKRPQFSISALMRVSDRTFAHSVIWHGIEFI